MSNSTDSNDTGNSSTDYSDPFMPPIVRFWILLIPNIASTFCSLFVLFNVLIHRKLRNSVKNHVLIVLLVFGLAAQLIDIPFYLSVMIRSIVYAANPAACLLWIFVDIGLYNGEMLLMAWMAFERHIIVFHDRWISSRKLCIIVHYLPLILLVLYILIFYIYTFFFYPCDYQFDYTSTICDIHLCYYNDPFLNNWDTYVNNLIPSLLEPLITLCFFLRVMWTKHRSNQRFQWRKQRRMMIQLLSLSFPNIVINFPLSIFYIAYLCGMSENIGAEAVTYLFFFCYYIILLFPFTCLFSIVDVRKIFREKVLRRPLRLTQFTATVKPEGYRKNMTTVV